MIYQGRSLGLLAAAALSLTPFTSVSGHSWPERTVRIAPNGTMVGQPGYERAHAVRGSVAEDDIVWLLPPNGRADGKVIHGDDKIAKPSQRALAGSSYTTEFPMLNVAAGDWVAIQYQENGHVTSADSANPTKPINRGTVYLYGTTEGDLSNVNLADIHLAWTADGKGGDGKGRLLATRNYDDGQCYQNLPAATDKVGLAAFRMKHFQKENMAPMGGDLWCQSDVQIPADVAVGSTYTVIWVWDWATLNKAGVAFPPASYTANDTSADVHVVTPQLYTGVVDYKVVEACDTSLGDVKGPGCKSAAKGGDAKNAVSFAKQTNFGLGAIKEQMENPFLIKVPQAGFKTEEAVYIPLGKLVGMTTIPLPLTQDILDESVKGVSSASAPAPAPAAAPVPVVAPAPIAAPAVAAPVSKGPSASAPTPPTPTTLVTVTSGKPAAGGAPTVTTTVFVTAPAMTVYVTATGAKATPSAAAPSSGAIKPEPFMMVRRARRAPRRS